MEQTMSKNAKPLLMMKALVLAYAVTGILLLLLAYLLYKLGLGWHFYSSFVSREVPLEVCFPERNTCLKITAML